MVATLAGSGRGRCRTNFPKGGRRGSGSWRGAWRRHYTGQNRAGAKRMQDFRKEWVASIAQWRLEIQFSSSMKVVLFIILALWVSLLALTSFRMAPVKRPPWALVWSDEFEGRRLDLKKWAVGNASQPNFDGGINIYSPQDVDVANGDLVIRSRRLPGGKAAYRSGRVSPRHRFSVLYGPVAVRASLAQYQRDCLAIETVRRYRDW